MVMITHIFQLRAMPGPGSMFSRRALPACSTLPPHASIHTLVQTLSPCSLSATTRRTCRSCDLQATSARQLGPARTAWLQPLSSLLCSVLVLRCHWSFLSIDRHAPLIREIQIPWLMLHLQRPRNQARLRLSLRCVTRDAVTLRRRGSGRGGCGAQNAPKGQAQACPHG